MLAGRPGLVEIPAGGGFALGADGKVCTARDAVRRGAWHEGRHVVLPLERWAIVDDTGASAHIVARIAVCAYSEVGFAVVAVWVCAGHNCS